IVDKPADINIAVNGAAIADGSSLTVTDQNGNSRIFEFDKNSAVSNSSHVRVAITNQSTPAQVAAALTTAINSAGLSLQATRTGSQIRLREDARVTLGSGLTGVDINLPGLPLDGDHDGDPGGVYNFWFRTAAPAGESLPGQ